MPERWADKPAKRSQMDTDARWTKKHGKSHYGYKNHVNMDRKHKLVRRMKLKSHIHRKGKRGKPLTEQAKSSNRTKSAVRAWVEHVFGAQTNDMGGTLVRTIGMVRAKAKIGMKNLAYNMRRLGQLSRQNPCPG